MIKMPQITGTISGGLETITIVVLKVFDIVLAMDPNGPVGRRRCWPQIKCKTRCSAPTDWGMGSGRGRWIIIADGPQGRSPRLERSTTRGKEMAVMAAHTNPAGTGRETTMDNIAGKGNPSLTWGCLPHLGPGAGPALDLSGRLAWLDLVIPHGTEQIPHLGLVGPRSFPPR